MAQNLQKKAKKAEKEPLKGVFELKIKLVAVEIDEKRFAWDAEYEVRCVRGQKDIRPVQYRILESAEVAIACFKDQLSVQETDSGRMPKRTAEMWAAILVEPLYMTRLNASEVDEIRDAIARAMKLYANQEMLE